MTDDEFVRLLDEATRNAQAARDAGGARCTGCGRNVPMAYIDIDHGACSCALCGCDVMVVGVSDETFDALCRRMKL